MHLAQLNIADAQYAVDAPEMVGFTGRIEAINAMAERAEGFVWRLTDDGPEDGALSLRMEGLGPDTLVNMSVWDSIESLYHFVYKTAHSKVMREERPHFNTMSSAHMVLWWIEDGHRPDLDEAHAKLELIRAKGATPDAFSFAIPFDEKGQAITPKLPKKDCA